MTRGNFAGCPCDLCGKPLEKNHARYSHIDCGGPFMLCLKCDRIVREDQRKGRIRIRWREKIAPGKPDAERV